MSGSASISLEQAILGHTLGFAQMAFPSSVFVALCSASLPPSETVRGIEAFGGGYTRMRASFALIDTPANIAANTTSIEWPIASASWGTLGYFELWDAATGGNRLYWGQFSPATPVTVAAGDIVRFSAGTLGVQASSGTGGTTSIGAYLPLAGGAMGGPLMLSHDPTTYLEAATKQYVDAHSGAGGGPGFLPLSGGTMLGTLSLAGNATLPMHAVPLQQVDTLNVVNVLNHGAKGDGTTDDTAAIQGVLNTYAGKATVLIPNTGHPYITTSLLLPSYTDLIIAGTLMLQTGGSVFVQNQSHVTIRGHGTIDCAVSATGNSGGINIQDASDVNIADVTVQNAKLWNFAASNSSHVHVDRVSLLGGAFSNGFNLNSFDCWLTNSLIDGVTGDSGFAFYGGPIACGAIGNTIRNIITNYGIYVLQDSGQAAPCDGITIAHNTIHDNGVGGIAVGASVVAPWHTDIIISNNRIYRNNKGNSSPAPDILIDHGTGILISDNLISSNDGAVAYGTTYGIWTRTNAVNVTIVGNSVYNIGRSGQAGVGLNIESSLLVNATGNTFHDFRATAYMSGIGGTAGGMNAYTNNQFGHLTGRISFVSVQADTAIFNPSGQGFSFGQALPTNAANDAAASAAGVPVGGMYRNGSVLMVRTV